MAVARADGRHRWYRVNGPALKPVHDWVRRFERTWNARLDRLDDLLAELHAGGRRTREIADGAALADPAALGGRFATADDAPTLAWTLMHVTVEYARHAGQLDVARELVDGAVDPD